MTDIYEAYNDYFLAYWGRDAEPEEVVSLITRGIVSEIQLVRELAKAPLFFESPVWNAKAPAYREIASEVLGQEEADKLDPELIREAIIKNADRKTFSERLRWE